MKKIKLVLLIALSFILYSCAHPQPPVKPDNVTVTKTVPNKIFDPGEYPMDSPEAVWKQYDCGAKELPLVVFENSSLNPSKINAGQQQINHLLVYAVCSRSSNDVLPGTISGKIYFRGKLLTQNRRRVELKPGRWSIVALIPIPPKAKPGTYELRTEFFNKGGVKLRTLSASFEVNR